MKIIHLFLIVVLFFITDHAFSQTFEKYISTDTDEVAHDALEIENLGYIILSEKSTGDFDTRDFMIKVYRVSLEGDFMDSLYIWIDDDYKLNNTRYIFQYDSNTLIIVGNCQHQVSLDYQLYLAFINTELEFISDTIIGDTTQSDFMIDFLLNEYGNIVGTGFCYNASDENIVFFDYNLTTYEYRRADYFFNNSVSTSTIIERPQINAYHSFKIYNGEDLIQINRDSLTIDTVYNLFPPNTDSFIPAKAVAIPNSDEYVVGGRTADIHNNYLNKISYRKYNSQGEQLDEHLYGITDTIYYFANNEADCIDSTYFYLGGTHNFENIPPFLFPEPRWIFINKLQMDGSIIWQHFYKGELNYMPYKILATSDGGALILSHKYDWNSPYPNQRDIHILKVDSNGYYSGMTSIDEVTGDPLQILVYPNPAKSTIHIATGSYDNLDFQLYDLQGKTLIHKHLNSSNHTISVEQLPSGMYLYTIMHNHSILERSRLIIQ